jgi:hypothetical protein
MRVPRIPPIPNVMVCPHLFLSTGHWDFRKGGDFRGRWLWRCSWCKRESWRLNA